VLALESKELHLLFALCNISGSSLSISQLVRRNALLEVDNFVALASSLLNLILDHLLEVSLAVLSLLLLSHREGGSALVKHLVRLSRHVDVVTNTEQQKATLRLVQSHLSNQLIKAFTEKFLADGADAGGARLPLFELLVEHFSETSDTDTSGDAVADPLHEVLALLDPLSRGQHEVEDILGAHVAPLEGRERCSFLSCYRNGPFGKLNLNQGYIHRQGREGHWSEHS